MSKQVRYIIGVILIIVIFVVGTLQIVRGNNIVAQAQEEPELSSAVVPEEFKLSEIIVDVEGAVKLPGVYRLPEGSVMSDAIALAGGFGPDVDRERVARELNQASPLGNHAKVYIFTKADRGVTMVESSTKAPESPKSSTSTASSSTAAGGLLTLNTATLAQLDALPGIGPAIAQRIIDWREANGGFEVVDDLKKVRGIGEALFAGIKDQVSVD